MRPVFFVVNERIDWRFGHKKLDAELLLVSIRQDRRGGVIQILSDEDEPLDTVELH